MKKIVLIVIGVSLLATSLFANGSEESASTGQTKKQVLTAMFLGSSQDQAVVDIIKQVTEEFNVYNEYNVEFVFETYENEQYKTKLTTSMVANSVPDVFFTWSAGYLKPFVEGGKVLPLDSLLNSDTEWKNRFNEGVFGPVTFNNEIYAVPHGQTVAGVFYNKDIFDKYNLEIPETFEDFKEVCQVLINNDITPISVPVRDSWIAGQFLQQLVNGVDGIDTFNGTKDGSVKWNDSSYVKGGELLKELVDMGAFPKGHLGMSYDEGRALFTQEKAAMFYMGSWDVSPLSDPSLATTGKVGIFNLPPLSTSTGNIAIGDVDQCLAISSNSKNPEAAAAYIKLFSGVNAQEAYAYNAKYLISTKTELDESKLNSLSLSVLEYQQSLTGVTPWLDRVFGAGEGVEFNNAANAIIAGMDLNKQLDVLQQFAEDNANR